MRYLRKVAESSIVSDGLTYERASDRSSIRAKLVEEQNGYCAYSERWIDTIDAVDIEHFDGRLKGTADDGYENWYAVLHWMNSHKPRNIEPYEPLVHPAWVDLTQRIRYIDGQFEPISSADQEALNLINYLGWNRVEVVSSRSAHVQRVMDMKSLFRGSDEDFCRWLRRTPAHLSFVTALEEALQVTLP